MKRLLIAVFALSLVAPTAATAQPNGSDRQNAAEECREMRSEMGRSDFADEFGTNRNDRNAFGKCVSRLARQEEGEREGSGSNAAVECKAKNLEGRDFGECVSSEARSNKDDSDERNAAITCSKLRSSMGTGDFNDSFGRNRGDRNSFGKCVSSMTSNED